MSYPESPDSSGKAPDHRDAALRAQAKGACKAPEHRDAALKASAREANNTPMLKETRNDGQAEKVIQKIELAEKVERSMGKDYPRAETLKNWMSLLQDKKASKIKKLTEEIDHYVKVGLGWGMNEPKELQEAIQATYDYAIEKRKAAIPKIDTKPTTELIEYLSRFQSEPYTTIKKGFVMLKDHLEKPWLFGLYEETQFYTPKQEVNWEIKLAKTRLRKDVFGLSEQVEQRLNALNATKVDR